jgi:MFS family permease
MRRGMTSSPAWKFVLLLGLVSLFSDMTYEGARSVSGPFLGTLQASALVVGVVAGLGEFLGYALRLASGYLADRTEKYWSLTLIGYSVNLLAVPLLALAWRWEAAAALLLLERIGKAVRTPARDAMLSHAARQTGRGWGFGFHEAMDQLGAATGPLIVAAVFYFQGGYRLGFATLLLPSILALLVLQAASRLFPHPQHLESSAPKLETGALSRPFWVYVAAVSLIGAGFVDFPLIAYHFHRQALMPPAWVPLLYAVAMAVDGLAALAWGKLYDRFGSRFLLVIPLASASFVPMVFWGGFQWALGGMVLWGIAMGAQESILKAALADMAPITRRASAYGVFHCGFGLFWFLGSALMGALYEVSLESLIVFAVGAQLLSVPLFYWISKGNGGFLFTSQP